MPQGSAGWGGGSMPHTGMMPTDDRRAQVRDVRHRLVRDGPPWTRPHERDFATVTLPERDCDLLRAAGLDPTTTLIRAWSSIALPALVTDGLVADAAFVDGSHRFHEVFVDLYYLRKIVRPGGLIVLDDDWTPSVRTAARYYERHLGWTAVTDAFADGTRRHLGDDPTAEAVPRCRALRLPDSLVEPPFDQFRP